MPPVQAMVLQRRDQQITKDIVKPNQQRTYKLKFLGAPIPLVHINHLPVVYSSTLPELESQRRLNSTTAPPQGAVGIACGMVGTTVPFWYGAGNLADRPSVSATNLGSVAKGRAQGGDPAHTVLGNLGIDRCFHQQIADRLGWACFNLE